MKSRVQTNGKTLVEAITGIQMREYILSGETYGVLSE